MARKADRQRFELMRGLCCVACSKVGAFSECDVSHAKSGNRRRGHLFTMLECPWHHRGVPPAGATIQQARERLGPSRALEPRAYRERFGDDEHLIGLTNQALEQRRHSTVGTAP